MFQYLLHYYSKYNIPLFVKFKLLRVKVKVNCKYTGKKLKRSKEAQKLLIQCITQTESLKFSTTAQFNFLMFLIL